MQFENLKKVDNNTYKFTLSNTHVTNANTLRRLILTGVESVAFRADMTSTGTTTDVSVQQNTTPMTNEMLAHRIGLLPVNVKDPLKWNPDRYLFKLSANAKKDSLVDVFASDFKIIDRGAEPSAEPIRSKRKVIKRRLVKRRVKGGAGSNSEDEDEYEEYETEEEDDSNNNSSSTGSTTSSSGSNNSSSTGSTTSSSGSNNSSSTGSTTSSSGSNSSNTESSNSNVSVVSEPELKNVPSHIFFPPHPITKETCLIATFPAGSGQKIELTARATIGTGRENARFIPVSQCTYEYTRDTDEDRQQEMFEKWLLDAKKVAFTEEEAESDKIKALKREFNTMEVARCYLKDEAGEPYSFDFTVESAGILDVPYIVKRACEVGENMTGRYVNIDTSRLPEELTISSADSRISGFDFLFRGHDHTLGNLLQTWLVSKHVDGTDTPRITFAGYKVPHPLRDEMILRVGVADGKEATARLAVAMAARGCVNMFREMRAGWEAIISGKGTVSNAVVAATRALRKSEGVSESKVAEAVASARKALGRDDGGVSESKTGDLKRK
jgi:DNA-directed RNA polymerase subunit L/DNA-directed RNA polymerase alpha subunit